MPLVVGRMHAHVYYARASPPFEREGFRSRVGAGKAVKPSHQTRHASLRKYVYIRVQTMRPTKRH